MQLLEGRPRPGSHPQGQPEGEDAYASKRAEKKVRRVLVQCQHALIQINGGDDDI